VERFGGPPHPWCDFEGPAAKPNRWQVETDAALRAFYGEPGEPPLVTIQSPYVLCLSWNLSQTTSRIACHEKVAGSLGLVLSRVLGHYGEDGVRERLDHVGDCFNARKKRGGTGWSTLDFDPECNSL
jgi:hypothetical protein